LKVKRGKEAFRSRKKGGTDFKEKLDEKSVKCSGGEQAAERRSRLPAYKKRERR